MDLIIDMGNTRVKQALFKEGTLFELRYLKSDKLQKGVEEIVNNYNIENCLIASVGNFPIAVKTFLKERFSCMELDYHTPVPFVNSYKTPETLGVDRMALTAAAVTQFPQKNVLVIDVGTCITCDFVTKKGVYLGGAIAPGIESRYAALSDYTENLPLLKKQIPEHFIGRTTDESIHSGVVNGICKEIDGLIFQYKENYEKLTVVLTGGDAEFLSGQLKNSIFVRPFFLLEGLYSILKFNKYDKIR